MSTLVHPSEAVSEAYDTLAPAYDALTAAYDYERWLETLERLALAHGLPGRRVLDVACGTGKSFLPLRARGYAVTGCDISAGMLNAARAKAPEVPLYLADMRDLPKLGSFDLVTCLDDALNYLLEEEELADALSGIARQLAPSGVAIWDLNTLSQYRRQFARDQILADENRFIGWRGSGNDDVQPGELIEIQVEVFAADGDGWQRTSSVHRQRHWPEATVRDLCEEAGLELLEVRGLCSGSVIENSLDESFHRKAIYVARRREEGWR